MKKKSRNRAARRKGLVRDQNRVRSLLVAPRSPKAREGPGRRHARSRSRVRGQGVVLGPLPALGTRDLVQDRHVLGHRDLVQSVLGHVQSLARGRLQEPVPRAGRVLAPVPLREDPVLLLKLVIKVRKPALGRHRGPANAPPVRRPGPRELLRELQVPKLHPELALEGIRDRRAAPKSLEVARVVVRNRVHVVGQRRVHRQDIVVLTERRICRIYFNIDLVF